MFLILTKLAETIGRGVFTLLVLFLLSLREAGQFGVLVTLIGLFALAAGWERYLDLQRRLVDAEPAIFDHAVRHAARFWAFNYLWAIPAFLAGAAAFSRAGWISLLLCVPILISEHIGNQVYNLSLVERRYQPLVALTAARNLMLAGLMLVPLFSDEATLHLDYVLACWAAVGTCSMIVTLGWAARRLERAPVVGILPTATRILEQHRASLTHFGSGLLGVLMLQADRLAVGGLLPLDEAGIYFRHTLLVSLAYQLFNIASYNRNLPILLSSVRAGESASARRIVGREIAMMSALVFLGLAALWGLDRVTQGIWTAHYSVRLDLIAILITAVIVRVGADFGALALNARMREQALLRRQLTAFAGGTAALVVLTWGFGILGAGIATLGSAGLYLLLVRTALKSESPVA